ncbi:hypothetical protein Tco_0053971 [Tanacetum coccineum]
MVSFYSSDIVSYTMVSSCFLDILYNGLILLLRHCELYNGLILLLGHCELRNGLTSFSDIQTGYNIPSPSVTVIVVMVAVVGSWSGPRFEKKQGHRRASVSMIRASLELLQHMFVQLVHPKNVNVGSGKKMAIKEIAELVKEVVEFEGELCLGLFKAR